MGIKLHIISPIEALEFHYQGNIHVKLAGALAQLVNDVSHSISMFESCSRLIFISNHLDVLIIYILKKRGKVSKGPCISIGIQQ